MPGLPKGQRTIHGMLPPGVRQLVEGLFPSPTEAPEAIMPGPTGLGTAMTPKALPQALRGLQGAANNLTQPKVGSTLYKLLERAGLKSGTGQALTPGERTLMQQFRTWGR